MPIWRHFKYSCFVTLEVITMPHGDSSSWKKLADEKEKEWRQILESRIEALENNCHLKDKELEEEKKKFNELKEHFKYNLKLLEDRDRELEKYDVSYSEIRMTLNEKNAEISELKIYLDDLKNVIKREEKTKDELQANYQRRLREKQAEVDHYKSCKDKELLDERKEYEEFRRNLQRQLTNVQNELDIQKRELTIDFEDNLKKREHEFKLQVDELNTKALEHELKIKILEKELELSRECNDKTTAIVEVAEDTQRQLEKLVKKREWELADSVAMKDAEISDLKNKLSSAENSLKKLQEDFQRKFTEMDKIARDKDDTLERVKNGYHEKEGSLQAAVQDLQSKLEDCLIRERQLQWANQDAMKEKEIQIENLKEEIQSTKERWDRHVAEISRNHVTQDLELNTALEEQRRLKLELDQRKEDLERYKRELKAASEREEKLDKAKTQVELDWQRRCEDLERQQYDKSEDLIKRLTTARNDAEALVKERERELRHKVLLVKSLHRERDQLRTLLKKADIPLDGFVKYSLDSMEKGDEDLDYMEKLQKENESLKQLITMMRQEIENLGAIDPQPQKYLTANNNADSVDEEVENLKQKNKELIEKLKQARKMFAIPPGDPEVGSQVDVLAQVEGNSVVKSHILGLNAAIGNLRCEKVELAATVKKQQARIAHLETALEEVSSQPRQKQIQIDQLTYELNNLRKRNEGEMSSLKTRIHDLELQLSEARREADEYHRASLENNQELVALGNQLASLKMAMSDSNPSINYGAQELYIQQLQSELSQLRQRAVTIEDARLDFLGNKLDQSSAGDLKNKLKMAAMKIVQLAKENQQLTESNNRLRMELKKTDSERNKSPVPFNDKVQDSNNKNDDGSKVTGQPDRLSALEKLQYQLTKQVSYISNYDNKEELQFVHRFGGDNSTGSHHYYNMSDLPEKDSSESNEKDVEHSSHPPSHSPRPVSRPHQPSQASPRPFSRLTPPVKDSQMLMSFSSGGGESIEQVWKLLEDSVVSGGSSLHLSQPTSSQHLGQEGSSKGVRGHPGQGSEKKRDLYLEGQKAPTELKSALKQQSGQTAAVRYSEHVKKATRLKPKVRNYNLKDDRR
ncbi:coiled-coil domain-containing protein 57-like [Physella acuta]|uniref:coiled-coil domain-containing protein 57-like n=1 Tax=Physella acuta TaxID=109671 RepID=UPI0027DB32AB|nr:coiled-coil domain-containing protein 57-like [Physella acuta]